MTPRPNEAARSADFEFEALREAKNYRIAVIAEFSPHISGRVLEVGAGIGQVTARLKALPAVQYLLAVEPSPAFCESFRAALPDQRLLQGTVASLADPGPWHTIVSINVLEHVNDDRVELAAFAQLLRKSNGRLCLFVPARPEIYAAIDRDFGHYRRYTKAGLRHLIEAAGFNVLRLDYFNLVGYFAWWLNFRVLGQRKFNARAVRLFDRVVFPMAHRLESRLCRPPIGQSLIAVATPS